jgi:hypothetical protein
MVDCGRRRKEPCRHLNFKNLDKPNDTLEKEVQQTRAPEWFRGVTVLMKPRRMNFPGVRAAESV